MDEVAQLELRDAVAPDGLALRGVELFEADGIVEPTADRLVHLPRRRVAYPDGGDLDVVHQGVHDAFFRRGTASAEEYGEQTAVAAQKTVGLVNNHQAVRGVNLVVANLDAGEAASGVHVSPLLVALPDFVGGVAGFGGERPSEGGLACSRRAVKEDVELALAGVQHLLEDFAVIRRQRAVEIPRKGFALHLPVEMALNRLVRGAAQKAGVGAVIEVPVIV